MNRTARLYRIQRWLQFVTALVTCITASVSAAQIQASGAYSITGKAINAATGSPLPHASVSLTEEKDDTPVDAVITGEDGSFQFHHLQADRYTLSGSHRGYIASAYDAHDGFTTALVLGEGQHCCEGLLLKLVPEGIISGTVTEDSGDRVEQGMAKLYRETNHSGDERIQQVRTAVVNAAGSYEFTGLEPGNYFLSVSATPWYATQANLDKQHSPLDMVYATTFYAEATDSDSATPIPIKGGDRIKIDFTLHPVPAVHIHLNAASPMNLPQLQQTVFGSSEPLHSSAVMARHNDVEMSIPPGQYQVRISGRDGMPDREVSLNATTDQAVDTSSATGTTMTSVSGKFAPPSGGALPDNAAVSLVTLDGRSVGGARLDREGTFAIHNVPPGIYRLNIVASGKRLHVSKMTASGAKVGHREVTIGNDAVTLAAMLYPDLGLAVSGFARKDGIAAPGAMIVLAPDDPVKNLDYFRRDQSNSDGSFVLKDVEPGRYTIVAIEDGWSLDWAQPAIMQHYFPLGQPIVVTEQSPQTTQLKEAVAVQAK